MKKPKGCVLQPQLQLTFWGKMLEKIGDNNCKGLLKEVIT